MKSSKLDVFRFGRYVLKKEAVDRVKSFLPSNRMQGPILLSGSGVGRGQSGSHVIVSLSVTHWNEKDPVLLMLKCPI